MNKNGSGLERFFVGSKSIKQWSDDISEFKKLYDGISDDGAVGSNKKYQKKRYAALEALNVMRKKNKYDDLKGRLFISKRQANAAKTDLSLFDGFDRNTAKDTLESLKAYQTEINNQGMTTEQASAAWEEYFNTLDDGSKYQKDFIQTGNLMEKTTDDIMVAQNAAAQSAAQQNAALDQLTLGAKATDVALKGLAMVGNVVASALISMVVSKALEFLYDLATAAMRAKETAQDYADSFNSLQKTQSSEAKTISEISDEYDKYASSVNVVGQAQGLTSDELERYHEICNQVADIMPELVSGYDSQGNAIVRLTGKYKNLTAAYVAHRKQEALDAYDEENDKGERKVDAVFKNFNNQSTSLESMPDYKGGIFSSIQNFTKTKAEWADYYKRLSKMSSEDLVELTSKKVVYSVDTESLRQNNSDEDVMANILHNMGFDEKSTADDLATLRVNLDNYVSSFDNELATVATQIKDVAMNYAQKGDKFWDLSEDAQSYFQNFIYGLDYDSINDLGLTTEKDVQNYVNNTLIEALSKNTNGINEAFDSLINDNLGESNLNPQEIADKYSSYIDTIADTLKVSKDQLTDILNIDNFDQVSADYQQAITDAQNKFTEEENFDWDAWFKDNSVNTEAEIQNWRDIAAAAETAAEARAKYTQEELPSIDHENMQTFRKQQEAISSAMSAQSSKGYLTQPEIKTILEAAPNLEAALEDTGNGLALNYDKVNELVQKDYELRDAEAAAGEAAAKMQLDTQTKKMVDLAKDQRSHIFQRRGLIVQRIRNQINISRFCAVLVNHFTLNSHQIRTCLCNLCRGRRGVVDRVI